MRYMNESIQRTQISNFKLKNDRSQPFNIISISNFCEKNKILYFLEFFLDERELFLLNDLKSLNQLIFLIRKNNKFF